MFRAWNTSKKSLPSFGRILPCLQRFRNHLSFIKSSKKFCLNCWDSWTRRFFSWLQNFCSSLLWRFRLCSSNSRLRRAFWWSSFSCKMVRRGKEQVCLTKSEETAWLITHYYTNLMRTVGKGKPIKGAHFKKFTLTDTGFEDHNEVWGKSAIFCQGLKRMRQGKDRLCHGSMSKIWIEG